MSIDTEPTSLHDTLTLERMHTVMSQTPHDDTSSAGEARSISANGSNPQFDSREKRITGVWTRTRGASWTYTANVDAARQARAEIFA